LLLSGRLRNLFVTRLALLVAAGKALAVQQLSTLIHKRRFLAA
jgi:hypothetical protein